MIKLAVVTKNEDGTKETKIIQQEIEEINGFQFGKTMKLITSILKELKEDEALKGLFTSVFGEDTDFRDVEIADVSKDFIMNGINSFQTLFGVLPDRAFELLAILSDIPVELLQAQKLKNVFDIYDAVIEENDIEQLVNRIKKSLALTAAKTKFINFAKKVTGTPESSLKAVQTQQ